MEVVPYMEAVRTAAKDEAPPQRPGLEALHAQRQLPALPLPHLPAVLPALRHQAHGPHAPHHVHLGQVTAHVTAHVILSLGATPSTNVNRVG
eukprot:1186973-Prorocentrum_minimum.AAC.3